MMSHKIKVFPKFSDSQILCQQTLGTRLEKYILNAPPGMPNQKLGWDPEMCALTGPAGDSNINQSLRKGFLFFFKHSGLWHGQKYRLIERRLGPLHSFPGSFPEQPQAQSLPVIEACCYPPWPWASSSSWSHVLTPSAGGHI